MKRLFYPPPIRFLLMVFLFSFAGHSLLHAEGSIDFRGYPGHRLFYNVEQNQQLKVFVRAGEFINVGSSHVGINGGKIIVYNPNGVAVDSFDGTGNIGIIYNDTQELTGPTGTQFGQNGYIPGVVQVGAGEGGVWSIRLTYPNPARKQFSSELLNSTPWNRAANQPGGAISPDGEAQRVALAWDVTVTQGSAGNAGGTKTEGRLYSNEYISMLDGNGRSTSPTFFVLTRAGYLYQVDFDRTDPWGFPLNSNSLGITDADRMPIYMSAPDSVGAYIRSADTSVWVDGQNYLYDPQAEDSGDLINNKIFFNTPDVSMPSSALVTDLNLNNTHETWLFNSVPAVEGAARPFTFRGNIPANSFCSRDLTAEEGGGGFFIFDSQLEGLATVMIDINGNGTFTDEVDVTLTKSTAGGLDSIPWNGSDGTGAVLPANPAFTFQYDLTVRGGEMHLLMLDIENNAGGVTMTRLNGPGGPDNTFYYDHSGINGETSGGVAGNPQPTTMPFIYSDGFGNNNLLDQWAFIETNNFGTGTLTLNIIDNCNPTDSDNDGVPDIVDIDDDNDGVPDLLEYCHPTEGFACLPNGLDPSGDSDNDGVLNYLDANDTAVGNNCTDANADGICDQILGIYDTDSDNVPDHLDLDSDNDGITDLVEAGHGQADVDGNGIIDGDNVAFGANGLFNQLETNDTPTGVANYVPWDWDSDGIPDHDDLDSDNDGILDVIEAGYANSDSDQDGRVDDGNGNVPMVSTTGLVPLIDPAITGNPIPLPIDWDSDGVPDWHDLDSDNDGILDVTEGGYQGNDTNGDGRIDDGAGNVPTVNSDGLPPVMDPDLTNQSINLPPDTDSDNVPDWHDLDSDNDGINDTVENENPDGDGDGFIGTGPITVDVNGIATADANGPVVPTPGVVNTDGEGTGDFRDLDADGDGINDVIEGGLSDPDGDGIVGTGTPAVNPFGQTTEANTSNPPDTDNDGTPDFQQVQEEEVCDTPDTPVLVSTATEICEGESVTISISNFVDTLNYVWTKTNGDQTEQITVTGADLTLNPVAANDSGTYTVVAAKDTCTSGTSNAITIVVGAKPDTPILSTSASEVCEGESVTMTIAGATGPDVIYTITAVTATGISEFTVNEPTLTLDPVTLSNAGTYTVVASQNGCPSDVSNSVVLSVKPRPDAPTLTVDKDIHCEGDRLEFMATPVAGATYEWTFTNPEGRVDPLATTTFPSLVIENLVATNTGDYQVRVVLDGCPSEPSNDVAIDVEAGGLPDLMVSSSADAGSAACEGETVTLTATEIEGVTYEWSGPNGVVGNSATALILEATVADSGEYTLTVMVNGCPKTFGAVTVQVNPKPETPTLTSDQTTVCPGEGFTLSTDAVEGEEVTYDWQLNGTSLTTTEDPNLVIVSATTDDSGNYTVIVNANGCVSDASEPVEITVEPPLEGDITMEPMDGVCEGQTVTLTAPAAEGASYEWTGPDGFTATTQAITIENVSSANNGDYSVVVTVNGCPTTLGPVTLEINPKPEQPTLSSDSETVCPGEGVTLTSTEVTGTAITYDWLLNGELVTTTEDPELIIIDFQEANAGDYTVIAKDGSCPSDASEPVSVTLKEDLEGVSASSNSPVCIGDTIQLMATDVENATYEWTGPNGFSSSEQNPIIPDASEANAGDYNLTVTVDGCPATIPPATVEVTPKPAAPTVSVNEGPFCEGTPATITVTDPTMIPEGTTFSVLDSAGNTVASGSMATIDVPTDGLAGTNIFTVISQIDGGCPSEPSNPVSIEVTPKPDEMAMIMDPEQTGDCGEAPITIEAVAPTQGTGMWSSDNPDVVFDNSNSPSTGISGLAEGDNTITWTLSNEACGEYSSESITITINTPVTVANDDSFTILNTEAITNESVTNNDTPMDGSVTVLNGSANGTGTIDANGNLNYTPNATFVGTDQITYELCNTDCPELPCDQATVTITVEQDPANLECEVPDVISPNNDNLNDALVIPCSDFKNVSIQIFNRWGDKVYESNNYQNDWMGTHDGADLPPGPYYYIFEENGAEPTTGCVSIAR
ncbi:MAG: gliding motility-associated C-terminal domain-containing protein [Bacteroidota bacterium]